MIEAIFAFGIATSRFTRTFKIIFYVFPILLLITLVAGYLPQARRLVASITETRLATWIGAITHGRGRVQEGGERPEEAAGDEVQPKRMLKNPSTCGSFRLSAEYAIIPMPRIERDIHGMDPFGKDWGPQRRERRGASAYRHDQNEKRPPRKCFRTVHGRILGHPWPHWPALLVSAAAFSNRDLLLRRSLLGSEAGS